MACYPTSGRALRQRIERSIEVARCLPVKSALGGAMEALPFADLVLVSNETPASWRPPLLTSGIVLATNVLIISRRSA